VTTVRTGLLSVLLLAVIGAVLVARSDVAAPPADAASPTLTVRGSEYGRILFDGSNHALYAFTRDPRGRSTCYGACAVAWPPYIVSGRLTAGAGTARSLIGTTRRRDGKRQLTYAGRPLYYYVHDGPGQVLCQNVFEFGGLWLVVRPSGKLVRLPR
jgi:predicted lipoprotein with Yx(FWY)xxD motif